jgi:predicted Zn-dependent protease
VAERLLTEAACAELAERIFAFGQGGGSANVRIISHWSGELRWGRNRVTVAGDRQETKVRITRALKGASAFVETNQLDPVALEAAVRAAERRTRYQRTRFDDLSSPYLFQPQYAKPAIWSDATYNLTAEERGRVARGLVAPAEAAGLLSAGYLSAEAQAYAIITSQGQRAYARMTQGRCAMTVRDSQGTGSGWAGKTSYDWAKIDGPALAARALQKCVDSRNPVALEPGRYTVILEPQAVADLLSMLMDGFVLDRPSNESPFPQRLPFWLRPGFSKLGLKVADERVTIGSDPMDPLLGEMPFDELDPMVAPNWIERGILVGLSYGRGYALEQLNDNLGVPQNRAWRMAGGDTSIDEMIATTKRGLLVTRFWNVQPLDIKSLLSTGLTRDGLWLIENGKIMKPVKNFRFVDSPLFVLNSLDQLGPAEPVFRPGSRGIPLLRPAVVPPIKSRDFSFTALVDAV